MKKVLTGKERVLGDFAKALERHSTDWSSLMARSFVGGLFTALGATVGLALVLGLAGLILDKLGVLPGVGSFFTRIDQLLTVAPPTK